MAEDQPLNMFSRLENIKPAGRWEMLKAKLFGELHYSGDETGGVFSYSYKGRLYIDQIVIGRYSGRPLFRFSFRDPGEFPGPGES